MVSISITVILTAVILIALIFALSNGLHYASSVVATCIVCGAATPKQAIGIASIFGMIGSILGGSAVADTISKVIDLPVNTSIYLLLLVISSNTVITSFSFILKCSAFCVYNIILTPKRN